MVSGCCKGHWWSSGTDSFSTFAIPDPFHLLYVLVFCYTPSLQLWSSCPKRLQYWLLFVWSEAGQSKLWQLLWVQHPLHPSYQHCHSIPLIWLLLGNSIHSRMLFNCGCGISCFLLLGAWWNISKHFEVWNLTELFHIKIICIYLFPIFSLCIFSRSDHSSNFNAAWYTISHCSLFTEATDAL